MREPRPRLTMQQRRRVRELRREGLKLREIVAELGCSRNTVMRVLHGLGKLESRQVVWSAGPIRLSLVEREEISLGLRGGDSLSAIATRARSGDVVDLPRDREERRSVALSGSSGAP